jgi:hypothetical protein
MVTLYQRRLIYGRLTIRESPVNQDTLKALGTGLGKLTKQHIVKATEPLLERIAAFEAASREKDFRIRQLELASTADAERLRMLECAIKADDQVTPYVRNH